MKYLDLESLLADKRNLEQILDNLMEGIIAHDKSRRILFFNRAAETITGFKKEEVVGRDCHEVFGGPFLRQPVLVLRGSAQQSYPYQLSLEYPHQERGNPPDRNVGYRDDR